MATTLLDRHPTVPPGLLVMLLALAVPVRSRAHDLWLLPGSFTPAVGAPAFGITVHVGHPFPLGDSSMPADRMQEASVHTFRGTTGLTDVAVPRDHLELGFRFAYPGEHVFTLVTRPRRHDLPAAAFNRYLEQDGAQGVLELRRSRGELDQPGLEVYSRHVKTLVRAGSVRDGVFTRAAGLELEIVPEADPLAAPAGTTLPVRLLFRGDPLADHPIHGGFETFPGHGHAIHRRTDARGRAVIGLVRPGIWYLRALHMIPADSGDPGVEWRSYWTSVTFEVPIGPGR